MKVFIGRSRGKAIAGIHEQVARSLRNCHVQEDQGTVECKAILEQTSNAPELLGSGERRHSELMV